MAKRNTASSDRFKNGDLSSDNGFSFKTFRAAGDEDIAYEIVACIGSGCPNKSVSDFSSCLITNTFCLFDEVVHCL